MTDTEPLSRQHEIFINTRVAAVIDVALTGLANSMGIYQSDRVEKFVNECRDSLGEVCDGFGPDADFIGEVR